MVVTEKKKTEEILKAIENLKCKSVAVIGCGSCATLAGTGSAKEVEEAKRLLKENGYGVVFTAMVETACHERLAQKQIRKAPNTVDCYLVLACGSGVQNIADVANKPVVAGLNTLFIGKTRRPGVFAKYCMGCGECILNETGGLCPKTRCPKSNLNGPCGGMNKGMCEVDPQSECIWVKIYERTEPESRLRIRFSSHTKTNLRPRVVGERVE